MASGFGFGGLFCGLDGLYPRICSLLDGFDGGGHGGWHGFPGWLFGFGGDGFFGFGFGKARVLLVEEGGGGVAAAFFLRDETFKLFGAGRWGVGLGLGGVEDVDVVEAEFFLDGGGCGGGVGCFGYLLLFPGCAGGKFAGWEGGVFGFRLACGRWYLVGCFWNLGASSVELNRA